MAHFEETRRIACRDHAGHQIVIIEQRKLPRLSLAHDPAGLLFDYITEDGQIATKLEGDNFFLLMTNEVIHSETLAISSHDETAASQGHMN